MSSIGANGAGTCRFEGLVHHGGEGRCVGTLLREKGFAMLGVAEGFGAAAPGSGERTG
jgi:hypothetical protein